MPGTAAGLASGPDASSSSSPGAALALRHMWQCDRRLEEAMAEKAGALKEAGERIRIRKFIREAVEER